MPGYAGQSLPQDTASQHSAMRFLVTSIINRLATTTLVRVTAVHNVGELAAVGLLDAQPMVHQVDGQGQPTPHGILNNVPYFRLQGGANAIIIDPAVGDIGIAVFCARDISSVKNSRKPNVPGSRRKYDWADGLYIGGVLNGIPVQFLRFHPEGIEITTPQAITLNGSNITLDKDGNLAVKGEIVRGAGGSDQITVGTHTHTQTPDAQPATGHPVAGS